MATKKTKRKKNLIIVESPSKARTIGRYLGSNYKVIASVGHVRDLPKSKLGVDIKDDFEPQYISIRGKGELIKEIKKEAKHAGKIYLATDPDREGEAISWHLAYLLGIDDDAKCRITFNEITKNAIKEAIKNPREIDLSLVDAQQARRVLDRLVGYQISPLLWRKITKGLSAGRVQSAALKMICDREEEIKNFVPQEYWNILATYNKKKDFEAKLIKIKDKKVEIGSKKEADEHLKVIKAGKNIVNMVEKKERIKKPYAPYTTSSLQQDASNKLNFNARKTMMIAQQLYEGVEIKGKGSQGLVSYIRTDSVRISQEAKASAKEFITNIMGENYWSNNFYSNKKKDIQDAHEAIRPSDVHLVPEEIKGSLSNDQYKLYNLIWTRFVASQMAPAKYDTVQAEIVNGDYTFKSSGSKLVFDGYQKVYKVAKEEDEGKYLPELTKGEEVKLINVEGEQNFTQPPSRYTEASLVKDLEEKGIGRPSTYAPIVATLTDRKYVKREKKSLIPTKLGFVITDLMKTYFKDVVDVSFTAEMEDKLDDVEMAKAEWKNVIRDFYGNFAKELEVADKEIEEVEVEPELTGETCELCGKPMAIKHGRFGDFVACTGYPECKNTKPIVKKLDVKCPTCGKGNIISRRSRKGKMFFGCSNYPNCHQVFWYEPVEEKCPECGSLLVKKKSKKYSLACSNDECNFKK